VTITEEEQINAIALTLVPGIGHIIAKRLMETIGSATDVFALRKELARRLPGISPRLVNALDNPQARVRAEHEYAFARKNHIRCLTYHDDAYPTRLRECDDAPTVLFYKGNADLNARRIVNMVGTRRATEYGTHLCATFLHELKALCPDILVASGLAYGIDIHAHRSALANGLPTVGVLAHGLDRIYPYAHRQTAKEMIERGGLLTEYLSGTTPDRHNFISRNRIVAGMSDATIVVESAEKGGSLITADIASSYHRDCFAFPGRTGDEYSRGCNRLIHDNKATMLLSAEDLVLSMGWDTPSNAPKKKSNVQRNLFPELTEEERQIVAILERQGDLQINTIVVEADIPVRRMTSILFDLEMKGVIRVLAGGVYQLL
jgi:DNA processing protein